MLATSKNVLFPGHNHLLTTGTDDPSLAGELTCSAVGCSVEGRAIDTALGQCFIPNHLISPGCPRPNSALTVQKSGLKHRSSIHPSIHFAGARVIIKVKSHQYRWLVSCYDIEIGHEIGHF